MDGHGIAALVVAAGRGARMGGGVPKQYRPLAGEPVLRRTVRAFLAHPEIRRVQVVIAPDHRGLYDAVLGDLGLPEPVTGGASRRESVARGLEALAAATPPPTRVLVHDGARPLVSRALVDRVVTALRFTPAVVPVVPVHDTLARVGNDRIAATVPREGVVRVQTPQGFALDLLRRAHREVAGEATDDASLVRALGVEVATVRGEETNLKLTVEDDFALAERLLAARGGARFRTGFGFDVHAFAEGRRLVLCNVEIPGERGLAGHSDADVALHAVTDAILATVGAEDIGSHFPPSDPRWRDADSTLFLRWALELLHRAGGRLEHVDLTLVCERPRIGPLRARLRRRLAALLGLPESRVSLKATTTEGLGFTGRGEGIAATAVVTARFPEEV